MCLLFYSIPFYLQLLRHLRANVINYIKICSVYGQAGGAFLSLAFEVTSRENVIIILHLREVYLCVCVLNFKIAFDVI